MPRASIEMDFPLFKEAKISGGGISVAKPN